MELKYLYNLSPTCVDSRTQKARPFLQLRNGRLEFGAVERLRVVLSASLLSRSPAATCGTPVLQASEERPAIREAQPQDGFPDLRGCSSSPLAKLGRWFCSGQKDV